MDREPKWQATFLVELDDVQDIMSALEDAPGHEPTAVSAYEIEELQEWYCQGLYVAEPRHNDIAALLEGFTHGDIAIEPIPELDWVLESLKSLKPLRAGNFYIFGSHNEIDGLPGDIPILVNAGQAFGTGHHATTRACLMALEDLAAKKSIENALDLGCGTGILSIGLAKVSDARIIASDIDPIAIEVAREVTATNDVDDQLVLTVAPGFAAPLISERAPYDLIIANILAQPLIDLAPQMSAHIAHGGSVLLSGLLISQEPEVLAAYIAQGFQLSARLPLEEWTALVLER